MIKIENKGGKGVKRWGQGAKTRWCTISRWLPPNDVKFALARALPAAWARAPGPPHRACLLHHHQVLPRRPCGLVAIRAALPIARALCHDFLVTATLATTALVTDIALSVTIVLAQDVQLHVLVDRPRCSACEGRGVRGLQDARGILGEVHTHGMVGHRSQLFVSHTVAFYLY